MKEDVQIYALDAFRKEIDAYLARIKGNPNDILLPSKLPSNIEKMLVNKLKSHIVKARVKYLTWYTNNRPMFGGFWHHHGEYGQVRANDWVTSINACDSLDALQSCFGNYFESETIRLNPHSFVNFIVAELAEDETLIAGLNLLWFVGRYNAHIDFESPPLLSGNLVDISLDLQSALSEQDIDTRRHRVVQCFRSLQQNRQPYIIDQIKRWVSNSFYQYLRHSRSDASEKNHTMHQAGTTFTVLSLLPYAHAATMAGKLCCIALSSLTSHHSGVIHNHGSSGIKKAQDLEHQVAMANSLDEIKLAFTEFFSNKFYWGSKTRKNPHSFFIYLLIGLNQLPDVQKYIQEQWFSPFGYELKIPSLTELACFQSPHENIFGVNINEVATSVSNVFDLFMALESRTMEIKP